MLAMEQLRRELALTRSVVDMVPAMLAYWDSDQRCVFANRAYEKWFNVRPDDLVGRTLQDLLGPIYPLNLPYILGALRGEPQEFEREIPWVTVASVCSLTKVVRSSHRPLASRMLLHQAQMGSSPRSVLTSASAASAACLAATSSRS